MERITSIIGALILAILLGYLLGRIARVDFAVADLPTLSVHEEVREGVPIVKIMNIRDGKLHGSLTGNVRFFLGEEQVLEDGSGSFAVDPGSLLINNVSVHIPEGMHFVASKRGKHYYPVLSRQGEQIVPVNRVYFHTSDEAESAGFTAS